MQDQTGTCGQDGFRPCTMADLAEMLAIINAGAEAYRGVIPSACWHEPYMSAEALAAEIAAGVRFLGCERAGTLIGIMGVQARGPVDLIRHAYVRPEAQGGGIGAALLTHLIAGQEKPILIGTWRAATWAIRFYERHGFTQVADALTRPLLASYWTIPEGQADASVVLAKPPLDAAAVSSLTTPGKPRV